MANEFVTDEHTSMIQKVVQEIVNDPTTYKGSALLPSVAIPAKKVRVEVIESTGGVTNEHIVGTDPQYIQSFGSRVQEFQGPAYKEKIHYDEEKILYLRELGQNDTSKRGVRQYIDRDVDRLHRRIEARIELLRWNAILNGGFSFMGQTISYGIPAGNAATPLGGNWSLDGISANNAANPIQDLRYWLMGGYGNFRKYTVRRIWMNPNTSRWLLDNTNTRAYVTSFGANPSLPDFDINKVLSFLIPGLPPVEVYNGWYQTETVTDGKITTSDAVFFIPDGKIFFEVSLPGNEQIGEFVQTMHLSSGSIDQPGSGKFIVFDDHIAPGTQGGPGNPFFDIIGGVYGGVKLDRPFDTLTATVYSA